MLGYEAKLYYKASPLTAAPDRTGWTELTIIKDVTLGDEREEVDETTRFNAGRKATKGGLRDNPVDFELEYDESNAGFTTLRSGYINNTPVALAIVAGAIATADGVAGNFSILSFPQNQPLAGHLTVSVTVKPYNFMGDLI